MWPGPVGPHLPSDPGLGQQALPTCSWMHLVTHPGEIHERELWKFNQRRSSFF